MAGVGGYILNKGISFGLLPVGYLPYGIVLGLLVLATLYVRGKEGLWILPIVCGGAVNCLDRFLLGGVRDYWYIPVLNVYNNLADWMIFVGVILFIIHFNGTRKII
jgi:lipoprotein signal peptidase